MTGVIESSLPSQIFMLLFPSLGGMGMFPCLAFEAVIDLTIFYRAIAGLGIAVFRENRAAMQFVTFKGRILVESDRYKYRLDIGTETKQIKCLVT